MRPTCGSYLKVWIPDTVIGHEHQWARTPTAKLLPCLRIDKHEEHKTYGGRTWR